MPDIDPALFETYMKRIWHGSPDAKTQGYVNTFFDRKCIGNKIVARVEGNHGTYTVSIEIQEDRLVSACSCYVGKGGYCHHCHALALAYLQDPARFTEVQQKQKENVRSIDDLQAYLQSVTLDSLCKLLSEKGVTQKAFAESIGMNPRHLTAIKSSEARNHYFNELGAVKLAYLWLLEHIEKFRKP